MTLAPRWRRELVIAVGCGALFALPGVLGQHALARALGRAQDLAALVSLGSSSALHLWLQPVDAVVSAGARVVILGLLVHALLLVLVGRRDWRGTLACLANASRVLAWAPLAAVGIGLWAWLVWRGDGAPGVQMLAYVAMKGWLGAQGALWLWTLARFSGRLRAEHGLGRAPAWFLGWAPAWALLATALVEAAL